MPTMDQSRDQRTGQDLDQINILRFRQIVKPENSFLIAINDLSNQVRYRIRQLHIFDYRLPVLIITSSAVALIIGLTHNKSLPWSEKAEKVAAAIGVTTSVLAVLHGSHSDRHFRRMTRASDYVKAWTTEPILSIRKILNEYKQPIIDSFIHRAYDPNSFNELRNSLADLKTTPNRISALASLQSKIMIELNDSKNSEIATALEDILNFFESMGQDVKLDVVDSDYLKEYFYSIVMNYYQLARKHIEYTQYNLGSRATWCNFVYLAQTWEKENVPPKVPKVCIRPLVITEDDIRQCKPRWVRLINNLLHSIPL